MNNYLTTIKLSLVLGCMMICHSLTFAQAELIDTDHSSYIYAKESLNTLKELLSIPNDANFPEDIEKNIRWVEENMLRYGFKSQRLSTETVPLLLLEKQSSKNIDKTVLFYFHIDGQPVDAQYWFQEDPYQATLKEEREGEGMVEIDWKNLEATALDPEWRIYARSASDDKSPFVMFMAVLEQFEKEKKSLPYNLKVILDFEEEKGSPRLAKCVEKNKSLLKADALLIFDGPMHPSNLPTLTFGARGITVVTLKVYGPTLPLHSGHYGNYAPNPALRLSQLLSSMKDDHGRVTIPGFYDGISIDQKTLDILNAVPDDENKLKVRLGIGSIDSVGYNYQSSIQYPSLNIRGLSSAWVGSEVRTIVPATATAEIDIRLVVESPAKRQISLLKQHIVDQGYLVLDRKPNSQERFLNSHICQFTNDRAYEAFRTELESPLGLWAYEAMKDTYGNDPIRVRTLGGSLPVTPFIQTLNVPAIIVPLVNSDNNQHSPNENLRLGNYFNGVKTFYALMSKGY